MRQNSYFAQLNNIQNKNVSSPTHPSDIWSSCEKQKTILCDVATIIYLGYLYPCFDQFLLILLLFVNISITINTGAAP